MSSNNYQKYNSKQTKALSLANKKQRSDSQVSNYNLRSAGSGSGGTVATSLHGDPLAIDHIFEQVLKSLSTPKLRECRRVSHRWNSIITSILLNDPEQELLVDLGGTKLKELVLLLQDRNSRPDINNLAPFPLGAFQFEIPSRVSSWKPIAFVAFMKDEVTKEFWTLHGINIRKLSLIFTTKTKTTLKDLPTQGIVMKEIHNLLTYKVPNLIYLKFAIEVRKNKGLKKPVQDLMHEKFETNEPGNNNGPKYQLKYFYESGVTKKVFHSIVQASPDLREIDSDSGDIYTLLYPLKKIHLLKRLCTYPTFPYHLDRLEHMSHLCGDGLNKMKLRELQFRVPEHSDPNFKRSIESINRILEGSSSCLEIICWDRAVFHSGLIWPSSLPKVSVLCFRAPFGKYRRRPGPCPRPLSFPVKFRWHELFPHVKNVYFYIADKRMKAGEFIKSFNLTPLQSVQNVIVRTSKLVPLVEVERISTFFPAAKVTIDPQYHTTAFYIPHD